MKTRPDIVLLSGIDYDAGHAAIAALQKRLSEARLPLPYYFTAPPNRGVPSGLDLDRDGRLGEPEDAHAFGHFRGAGGMVLLSRYPVVQDQARDFTHLLWADFPAADFPFTRPGPEAQVLRLSGAGHWDVPVRLSNGTAVHLLALHATPPVFDGPEDRNGRRNADQIRFWVDYLNGWDPDLGIVAPPAHAIVLGALNSDPHDGAARREPLHRLLNHPALQDPRPASEGAVAARDLQRGVNLTHTGPASLDTVDWPDSGRGAPGNLRVDYVLPSRDFEVAHTGVHWPATPEAGKIAAEASRHRLVWIDLRLPPAP